MNSLNNIYVPYQGLHLLADLHGAKHLDNIDIIERALSQAAHAAGAVILDVRLHHFGPDQGVTGVVLLAESHISIHTWPEHNYAAIDIFVCGIANDAHAACDVIAQMVEAEHVERKEIARGYAAQ
jgi:S-adenosylmethionine decarboxylase